MAIHTNTLPSKICLNEYAGNYQAYIDAVYEIFKIDFIDSRPSFGSHSLGLKFHSFFQDRAYTFYHMTHTGDVENERIPDLRRCECMPWGKPTVENVIPYSLKFWDQKRNGKYRICIWLETEDDVDYIFILDVRKTYILPWTAFVLEYSHAKRKKEKEYNTWLMLQNGQTYSPDELVDKIRYEMP